jgi:hypothetical protein
MHRLITARMEGVYRGARCWDVRGILLPARSTSTRLGVYALDSKYGTYSQSNSRRPMNRTLGIGAYMITSALAKLRRMRGRVSGDSRRLASHIPQTGPFPFRCYESLTGVFSDNYYQQSNKHHQLSQYSFTYSQQSIHITSTLILQQPWHPMHYKKSLRRLPK